MTSDKAERDDELRIFVDNEVTARILSVVQRAEHNVALITPYVDRVGHVEQELVKAQQRSSAGLFDVDG